MNDALTLYVSGPREAVEAMLRRQAGGVGADAREGYARRVELEALSVAVAEMERWRDKVEAGTEVFADPSRGGLAPTPPDPAMQRRIDDLTAALADARMTIAVHEETLAARDRYIRGLCDDAEGMLAQRAEMMSAIEAQRVELAALRVDLQDRDRRISDLDAQVDALGMELDSAEGRADAAECRLAAKPSPATCPLPAARGEGEQEPRTVRPALGNLLRVDRRTNRVTNREGDGVAMPVGGPILTVLEVLADGERHEKARFIGATPDKFASAAALERILDMRRKALAGLGLVVQRQGAFLQLVATP